MSSHIKIGVFIPNGAQLLDVACVDTLGVMSKTYLGALPFLPSHVASLAPDVSVYYVSSPEQGPEIPLTSGAVVKATHVYTDEEVAPGKLDMVVVPGPDPTEKFAEKGLKWLRGHAKTEGVDVLSICTGLFICASAGIVEGKRASGPRGLQSLLKEKFPGVKLVGDLYRWVQDGNFWSSGGVTNGNELVAAYARASQRWAQPVVEAGLMLTEVGDRGQFYEGDGEGKGTVIQS
ncbi:ThiJ/PfpI family protein [Metarhizium rileyi]|uniref:ThiJ/PfpI family protein n=1 Tax=Metarhizium rileyi (strain RCEF 4871) TaxID=1649241 RepID=A0A162KD61_METRR|nr:ThiJ/PfpI family protein [Metarhizium rileyi RCEF 4871]